MQSRKSEIVTECVRQSEACLYTSTSLYLWLRSVRFWNRIFIVSPIIVGGLAGWGVLATAAPEMAAGLALLAGFFPAIYEALKMKGEADEIAKNAGQFKVLQDRFRQTANIGALASDEELESEFRELMGRMDAARTVSLTAPQKFFLAAKEQIDKGHYTFTVDAPKP